MAQRLAGAMIVVSYRALDWDEKESRPEVDAVPLLDQITPAERGQVHFR